MNNLESQRRQYGLADRARQLGWSDVAVIDDDLGRSGGGVARPGFEKLLAAICEAKLGLLDETPMPPISGMRSVIAMTSSGLVPHVTIGCNALTSIRTSITSFSQIAARL